MSAKSDELRFLTYNAGMLRLRMFGMEVFTNPPGADARLPHVIEVSVCLME
jgi:hypothetical protein